MNSDAMTGPTTNPAPPQPRQCALYGGKVGSTSARLQLLELQDAEAAG